ncbi:MAG: 4-hydroxybenzoyl-CoA reductase subunit beta [Alphaproteobacteria bacterium]
MELLSDFTLHRPTDIAEAVKLHAGNPQARYLAGGTDMMVNVRRGIEQPGALIDLGAIDALRQINEDGDGLHIGAGIALETLATHAAALRDYTAIAEAAAEVAGPTHRQYGTVGGNLCLDTRCLYYNQSEWWRSANEFCLKNLGETCHVASGGKSCFAAFSGDVAPALLVHGAEIEIIGPDGARRIKLAELYRDDGMDHLTLKPGELLTMVHVPRAAGGARSSYAKARVRGSIDFPLAGAAVRLQLAADGTIADLKVALTAVNPSPRLLEDIDSFAGRRLDDDALDELRDLAQRQARPMKTTTIKPWYRRRVAGALVRRLAARLANA